jgi:glycyl-tRNA synthetase beta chain
MPEFFLELFSEEIPARMQAGAIHALSNAISSVGLETDIVQTYYGPRRIAISATVASEMPGYLLEERGPRDSAPEAAFFGFLKKHNASRDDVIIEGGYYILRRRLPPIRARDALLQSLPGLLITVAWRKSMRWGTSGDFTWIRPLRRIVCLLDGEVIPIKFGPVTASNETEGQRVLGLEAFGVSSVDDWKEKLKVHHVIADQDERKKNIIDGVKAKATNLGLSIAEDVGLLDEINGLVEWPIPLIGKIDEKFMDLPPEVRELSMKANQKYFALRDADGKPAPYFAFVANLEAPDGGAAIIAGNERVLRARFSDARHFWGLDLKTPLDALLPKLEKITFHAKIGTQRERVSRISARASEIVYMLGGDSQASFHAETAGLLSKADLVTGMVGEFPELQGIMGGYYAEKNPRGWDGNIVGPAIKTHYQPKGPSDAVPTGTVAVSVALADKLDALVEFFRIDEKPTGSSDPYALRRAALGLIRIILENNLRLPLRLVLNGDESLFDFITERLRVKLRGEGKRFDILDAVLAADADDDLVRLMKRVDALGEMLVTEDGTNLLSAYKRAANILKIEDAKDGPHTGLPEANLLIEYAERSLNEQTNFSSNEIEKMILEERFVEAMRALSYLREPIDEFFLKLKVNAELPEIRRNRLKLLARFRDTVHQIADFSKIEG